MAAKSAQPPGGAPLLAAHDDTKQKTLALSAVYMSADSQERSHAVHSSHNTDIGSCDDDRLSVIAPPTPCTSADACPPPPRGESRGSASHATAAAAVASGVRVCAHCRTLKTPLWRNGPHGPKTLCNACGVRFKLGKLQVGANGQLEAVQAPPPIVRARPPPPPTVAPTSVFLGTPRQQQRRMNLLAATTPLQKLQKKKPQQPQAARTVKSEHAAALLLLALAGCSH